MENNYYAYVLRVIGIGYNESKAMTNNNRTVLKCVSMN